MFEKNLDYKLFVSRFSSDVGGHVGHLGARFSKNAFKKSSHFFMIFQIPPTRAALGVWSLARGPFFLLESRFLDSRFLES